MSRIAVVYGGSGFLGRYVVRRLAADGWRVRVGCRHPEQALFVRTYGAVGQVEPFLCNIRDDASVARLMEDAEAVVNLVGILVEHGRNTFEAVHVDGAERIARIAAEKGVRRLVHVSAIGAAPDAPSRYGRTKCAGEKAVHRHVRDAVILRPSVMFGPEDEFFNRFARMARLSPVIPIAGASTLFQPVYVDDVARVAMMAIDGEAGPGVYELGGPGVHSFRELMQIMLKVIHRRRLVVNMPRPVAGVVAGLCDFAQAATLGLWKNSVLTRDQLRQLRVDNVASGDALGFEALGLEPAALEAVLPEYLWPYRPAGQYDELRRTLKRLSRQP